MPSPTDYFYDLPKYLYLLVYIYQYYVLALIVSKSKLVTLTKRTNLSATHCHLQ